MLQHLVNRSPIDPKFQRRMACAHAVAMTGQPNLAIKPHLVHLPALPPLSWTPKRESGALLRRRRGPSTALRGAVLLRCSQFTCAVVRRMTLDHAAEVRRKTNDLRRLERVLKATSINPIVGGLRFFYGTTLGRKEIAEHIPFARQEDTCRPSSATIRFCGCLRLSAISKCERPSSPSMPPACGCPRWTSSSPVTSTESAW